MDCATCISRTRSILMGSSRSASRRAPQIQICQDSKQARKLAVALTGEWRSLLQPENMEKEESEKSIGNLWEINRKSSLTDASFPESLEEKPSFSGLKQAITTSVKAAWPADVARLCDASNECK